MDGLLAPDFDRAIDGSPTPNHVVHLAAYHGNLHHLTQFAANQFEGTWLNSPNTHTQYTRLKPSNPHAMTQRQALQIIDLVNTHVNEKAAFLDDVHGVLSLHMTNDALEKIIADPTLYETMALGYETIQDRIDMDLTEKSSKPAYPLALPVPPQPQPRQPSPGAAACRE